MNLTFASPKARFLLLMLFAFCIAVVVLDHFTPTTRGWWIFQRTEYYPQYFAALALVVGTSFVGLITLWYKPAPPGFDVRLALEAFAVSGALSILLSLVVLYPLWDALGFREVTTGWWIFASTEVQPKNPLFGVLTVTGAIAGPVEELAKLVAVLAVPALRRRLRSPKFALYSVALCAFGFAMIENFMYFSAAQGMIVLRANPAHAVFSALWGIALGRLYAGQINLHGFLAALALGMGLHALWNICASTSGLMFLIVFVLTSWKGLGFIRRQLGQPASAP